MPKIFMRVKFIYHLWAFTAGIAMMTLPLCAQYQSLSIHAGPMDMRGDLKEGFAELNDLGFDLGLTATHTLMNERWRFLFEVSYYSGSQKREFPEDSTGENYLASRFSGTTIMLGSRYVLTNNVNQYNSYPGQIIPFAGLMGGVTFSNARVSRSGPQVEFFDDLSTQSIIPVFEAQLGLNIGILKRLRGLVFASCRYAISDFLEGVEGSTQHNDLMLRLGVGLTYNITRNPNEIEP